MKRLALSYQTVVCLSCPVCDVSVLWPNGWVDQDETSHEGRPRPWPHCVRWETSSPPPKGALPPIFAHVCCDKTARWIKMPWFGCRPRPWPHCNRWGPSSPPPNGHSPQFNLFSAHVCCGQTAGWIEMPFSREVGLSPSDIVLDGEPGPFPQKGGTAPPILANVLWPNGCFKTFCVPWQTFAKIGPGTSKNRWTAKNKNNKTKNITVFGYRYTRERRATVKNGQNENKCVSRLARHIPHHTALSNAGATNSQCPPTHDHSV